MDQLPTQDQNAVPAEIMEKMPHDDVEENKDIAALSYVWILSLVVFFTRRNSPFVRFHAKQGIVLFILSIAFWMVPFVGRLLELVVLAFCAFGFINAAQGKWKDLPFIGAMTRGDWKAVRQSWRSVVHSIAEGWRHFRKDSHKKEPEAKPQESAPVQTAPTPTPTPDPVPPAPQPASENPPVPPSLNL